MIVVSLWLIASPGHGDGDEPITTTDVRVASASLADAPEPRGVSPLPDGFVPGSSYGYRASPRTGQRTFHAGIDFLAPRGTSVRVARGGIVERVMSDSVSRRRFGGYGNAVVVRHPDVQRWSFYAHLDSVAVSVGQTLRTGELIGSVGNSTNHRFPRMANHLHFEVRRPRPGRSTPFPARYRRYNVDPRAWLASLGVRFGEPRGHSARIDPASLRR